MYNSTSQIWWQKTTDDTVGHECSSEVSHVRLDGVFFLLRQTISVWLILSIEDEKRHLEIFAFGRVRLSLSIVVSLFDVRYPVKKLLRLLDLMMHYKLSTNLRGTGSRDREPVDALLLIPSARLG